MEAEHDRNGALPDTRPAEKMTLAELLVRYRDVVPLGKRSSSSEVARVNAILRRPIYHRTLALHSTTTVAAVTVARELSTISHAIETARCE